MVLLEIAEAPAGQLSPKEPGVKAEATLETSPGTKSELLNQITNTTQFPITKIDRAFRSSLFPPKPWSGISWVVTRHCTTNLPKTNN